MKNKRNINRRRFLKEGVFWCGAAAAAVLFRGTLPPGRSARGIKPRRARHYRRLAG